MSFDTLSGLCSAPAFHSRLKSTAIRLLPSLLFLAVLSFQLFATTLPYKSFEDLVKESDGIVAGRVAAVESQYNQFKEIYTFVTLDQLENLSGSYQEPTLTLRFKGGQIGNDIAHVVGSPEFKTNERVVLFVHGNGRYMAPVVGWTQGVFRIVQDAATGQQVINDAEGNRVVGLQNNQVLRDLIVQPEAQILGQQQGFGSDRSQNQTDAGSPDSRQPASASETAVAQANALHGMPTMTSQVFLDAIRRSASAKSVKSQLTSVRLADFSVVSGNTDAGVGPTGSTSQATQQGAPTQPQRKPIPQVKDQN